MRFLMSTNGWIGVDFDKTLCVYHGGELNKYGSDYCGPPIPAMVERVKAWLAEGKSVKIFTARVWCPNEYAVPFDEYTRRKRQSDVAFIAIRAWCKEHIGCELPITCEKDYNMIELWDDRAVQVVPNLGHPVRREYEAPLLSVKFKEEREFVDAIINAIGEISVAEAQAAIAKWRTEHG